jgi:hypothetical protein
VARAATAQRARAALAAAALSAAALACAYHADGEAGALAGEAQRAPAPAPGASLADAIAVVRADEGAGFSVEVSEVRVSKVAGGFWEEVDARRAARPDFVPDAGAVYVVSAKRRCEDWKRPRDRFEAERASWFLLPGGAVAAYDHWSFGPRCALANALRPARPEHREVERELLRFLEQRHPPRPLPFELRIARGLAFVAAGRLDAAHALLASADQAIGARRDLFEERTASAEEEAAFEAEQARLRALRADLARAIREAERKPEPGAAGAPGPSAPAGGERGGGRTQPPG